MMSLDDAAALAGLDPGGMLAQVASLPEQLGRAAAVQAAFRSAYPDLEARLRRATGMPPRQVLVCGMGGSAIGGDMAAAWAAGHGVRVAVHRDYGLPSWVDSGTLLLFSSYSGNTEETLAAFDAGVGAARICIATGGVLAERARAAGAPLLGLPGGLQPRAAVGHSLVAQLVLLHAAGLVRADPVRELTGAAAHLQRLAADYGPGAPEERNRAKQLARSWHDHLPVIWTGPGILQPVGVRWRCQIAENAKCFASASAFPELDHNEIMAWQGLEDVRRRTRIVVLRDRDDAGAIGNRMRITAEIVAPHVAGLDWVESDGDGVLERMLGCVFLGDHASVYLALLDGVDPTPVGAIEMLKQRLAS